MLIKVRFVKQGEEARVRVVSEGENMQVIPVETGEELKVRAVEQGEDFKVKVVKTTSPCLVTYVSSKLDGSSLASSELDIVRVFRQL